MLTKNKLGTIKLTALVIGGMIGGGIFSLPENMASEAQLIPSLIAWCISGTGMLALCFVFIDLSINRPSLETGIYSYSKAGFGNLVGFASVWGYWCNAVIANASYLVFIVSSLYHFFPYFSNEGNSFYGILIASCILWVIHCMILSGLKNATNINSITTLTKIIPLIVFIIICLFNFNPQIFYENFSLPNKTAIFDQVSNVMIVTVWVFIGIEFANNFSQRAKSHREVAISTTIGFFFVLGLLILVTIVSFGSIKQDMLSTFSNPSTAYVLYEISGRPGFLIIIFGVIVSLFGALLAWTLSASEVLFQASKNKALPSLFYMENKKNIPRNALLFSNIIVQLFLVLTYFHEQSYKSLFYLATSMIFIPYFFSSGFGLKAAIRDKRNATIVAVYSIALIYVAWIIYAAGIKYLFLSSILYTLGLPFHIKAHRENKMKYFEEFEKLLVFVILSLSICACAAIYTGLISIN